MRFHFPRTKKLGSPWFLLQRQGSDNPSLLMRVSWGKIPGVNILISGGFVETLNNQGVRLKRGLGKWESTVVL